jgi:diguanylate cyclase (GGDEF)-like protein/PAS domain S-box-containing protein
MMSAIGLSVLMIDDDEDDVIIVRELLSDIAEQQYRVSWARSIEDGLSQLRGRRFDAVLMDYRLENVRGTDYLADITDLAPSMPVLILTGQGDVNADQYALDSGAADYLVKQDMTPEGLHRTLRYAIERQGAYDILAKREHYYRHLFDSHPSACIVYDRFDLTILALNEAAEHLYQSDRATLIGANLGRLFARPTTDFELFMTMHRTLSDLKRASAWSHITSAGVELDVELLGSALDYQGQAAQLLVVSDRTPQIRADRDARESERALLQLLSDSRDAIVVLDRGRQIQYANLAAETMFGLENSQWGILDVPLNGEDHFEWSWSVRDRKCQFEVSRSYTRWGGQEMTLLAMRDITARKRAEERLHILERSLESTSNGVVIADARLDDLPIIYSNQAFTKITGYSAEEVLGKNCRFLQQEDRNQAAVHTVREALNNFQQVNVVVRNYRKDGTPFWNELFIAPVEDDAGDVTHFIGVQNDISAQKQIESTLAYNASHDVLTALPNRALVSDRIVQAASMAKRYKRTMAVLYLDLDEFKLINDALGHLLGDRILIEASRRLQGLIRPGDTLARMSADEFVILLPDLAEPDDVIPIVDAMLHKISEPFDVGQAERIHITASIGIALSDGELDDPISLLRRSDLAMYQAKQAGRNRYRWYDDRMSEEVSQSVRLRSELQIALKEDQFLLFYQPQFNLLSGQVVGFEALIRWQHPTMGFVSPGRFIPIAENNGQIGAITDWVVAQACIDRARLNNSGFHQPIAINLSPVLFKDAGLVDRLVRQINGAGLSCSDFELEIVESVMVGTSLDALQVLNELRAAGFLLSIDDFGTGFSSLNYLKHLPIQKLKIDQSFIREIIHDQSDASIVRAIISIARNLGIKVIAEGVETQEQASFLRREHCDDYQGFLRSPAVAISEVLEFMRKPGVLPDSQDVNEDEPTLLIVDDEPYVLTSLNRTLRNQGYRILTAGSAEEAFRLLAGTRVQVILSDQRMPVMSGTEFLKQVRTLYPETIRMVISGYTDLKTVTNAINEGAIYKFLTKPWDDEQLRDLIGQAFAEVTGH